MLKGHIWISAVAACLINSRLVISEDDFPIYRSLSDDEDLITTNCFQEIMHMNKVSFNSSVQVHELEFVCVCERERERERGERSHGVSCDESE